MNDVHLVLFDCDGTLVDSQASIVAAMHEAFRGAGIAPPAAAAVKRIVGLTVADAISVLAPDTQEDDRAALAASFRSAFAALRANGFLEEALFPGWIEALDALEADGYLLGVATGKSMRGLAATLAAHGLDRRFVTMQTADIGPGKPSPEMLFRAMTEAGTGPRDTVMIGDTTFDMQMAVNAACAGIGVAWGYHEPHELHGAGARTVVDRPTALLAATEAVLGGETANDVRGSAGCGI